MNEPMLPSFTWRDLAWSAATLLIVYALLTGALVLAFGGAR